MSFDVRGYLLDIEQLLKIPGSSDSFLTEKIGERYKRALGKDAPVFSGNGSEISPPILEPLNKLIQKGWGTEGGQNDPCMFGRYFSSLEFLVSAIGRELPNDSLSGIRSLGELSFLKSAFQNGSPISIPVKTDGSILIGHLTAKQVAELYEQLKERELPGEDPDVDSALNEVIDWYEEAVERNLGIVIFVS